MDSGTGIHDAEPYDVYVDAYGQLWRVMSICKDPTVTVQRIDPPISGKPEIKSGSIYCLMFGSFTRIFRDKNTKKGPEIAWIKEGVSADEMIDHLTARKRSE